MSDKKLDGTADKPLGDEGRQYHIRCRQGDVSRYVLLPTDPFRNDKFAEIWTDVEEKAHYREYRTHNGRYKGTPLTVTSTGIGDLSTSIAVEELARCGADTLIRVGTTGALQADIPCGSLIINSGMVRGDGTTKYYIQPEYPAVAHFEVVMALVEACERLKMRYFVGIGVSSDSFYLGQARPGFKGYWQSNCDNMIADYNRAGLLNLEGEASTVLTLASLYGLRAGFISTVIANRITNAWDMLGEAESCLAASEAVSILAGWDELKKKKGARYVTPALFE